MRLVYIIENIIKKHHDRPAIGERVKRYIKDAKSKRIVCQLAAKYQTITYQQLWNRAESIANEWYQHDQYPLKAGDKVVILSFIHSDYIAINLACVQINAIIVPLQTNLSNKELTLTLQEIEPRIIAASIEYLPIAVELAKNNNSIKRIIVFDYDPSHDNAEKLEQLQNQSIIKIEELPNIIRLGSKLPKVPYPENSHDTSSISMIIYTSGSTGAPKGAIYTEKFVANMWDASLFANNTNKENTTVLYLPISHCWGNLKFTNQLAKGGTCYLVAKSNLSTLFEDIALAKPIELSLVPRVCEMIFQQYQSELEVRKKTTHDPLLDIKLKKEIRTNIFGGRITNISFGSGHLAKKLADFIESLFEIKLYNDYGSTETLVICNDNKVLKPPVEDYKLIDVPELGYYSTDKPYPRGELLLKTATIISGYYKHPELNSQIFDEQGYYKTGDIVKETAKDHLVFIERRKNVIKLSQGEFIITTMLETLFKESPLIKDIFIYGNSKWSYLLAVIIPIPELLYHYNKQDNEIKQLIQQSLKKIAKDANLKPYEAPRDFLIDTEPFSQKNGLLSELGKPLRQKIKTYYINDLNKLHQEICNNDFSNFSQHINKENILETVIKLTQYLVGSPGMVINSAATFRQLGGDSLSTLQFSLELEKIWGIMIPVDMIANPTCTLDDIADYIKSNQCVKNLRPTFATIHGIDKKKIYAYQLALDKFIDPEILQPIKNSSRSLSSFHNVLLTGANGYLGKFLCLALLEELNKTDGKLICVIREKDSDSARQRLINTFSPHNDQLALKFKQLADKHLTVYAGDLTKPNLGLDEKTWHYLSQNIDHIFHAGALVNHILPYQLLFETNVLGTAELIKLALVNHLKHFVFISSIIVVIPSDNNKPLSEDDNICEAIPYQEINNQYANGYAISKWASEILLHEANNHFKLPVTVFRPSMILAHRQYATELNINDVFTRLLLSIINTKIAPKSFYQSNSNQSPHYNGLAVDFVVSSIIKLAKNNHNQRLTFNMVNPQNDKVSLDTIIDWLINSGINIKKIDDYEEWYQQFKLAMKKLPSNLKQYSMLPVISLLKQPEKITSNFWLQPNKFSSIVGNTIPAITPSLISKYIADFKALNLLI
ncbi:thioester reductase domain-containing protein [Arsenophonus sp. aPb]|uniref:thioester reductase domain-containing protein n=1 Tax=Arsenophonus sp. aPb TaxID=3041619 RepID=UPI002468846B|nr:thioester reductase domain-containing protein [Arsenophonus sp. aPb]WGL97455.1 thioester reductase domain-containing protein [Arsenophonus sp. aPb]